MANKTRQRQAPGVGGNRGAHRDSGKQRQISAETTPRRWPELRINRQVNIDSPETCDWNEFVNYLGRANYGKGRARAVGSMACTTVTAQEFGRMIEVKYPKISTNRHKSLDVMRRVANNFNDFVSGEEQFGIKAAFDLQDFDRVLDASSDLDLFTDPDDAESLRQHRLYEDVVGNPYEEPHKKPDNLPWSIGSFAIKGVDKFGAHYMGLDLSNNGELLAERDKIIKYLQDDGFQTSYIDRRRKPHIVVFDTLGIAGISSLRYHMYPDNIVLDPPKALLNSNF